MSRLRELRLHGFKTFADPTRFAFEPGVTAVIGPNGSGKSNMADAVRWVLGEQSNRSLRMRKADDVVFGGSQQRRPQGMAEAILVLDNSDRWLPIDYAEVSIGRRTYRSGEAEYLLNGARVRLREITQLLGEGRLGASDLVVVGQGTVDAALSLRPEERRQLFEEAAGVKALQVRKNESLGKLGSARENLTRVRDLVSEIKPQARRLALQAEHQERHGRLAARMRAVVLESHGRRERDERAALAEAARRAAAADAALATLRERQADEAQALADASARYWDAEAAARAASGAREQAREAAIRAESRAEAVSRRRADAEVAARDAETVLVELERRLASVASVPETDGDAGALESAADAAERDAIAAGRVLEATDRVLTEAEDALGALRQSGRAVTAQRWELDERVRRAASRLVELERDAAEMRELAEASTRAVDAGRDAAARARAARDAAMAAFGEAQAAVAERERLVELARSALNDIDARLSDVESEVAAIERRRARNRLVDWFTRRGGRRLLDELRIPSEAAPAVAAVLGGSPDDAVLASGGDAGGTMVELTEGVARLVLDGGAPVAAAERATAAAAVNGTRTLAEWIGEQPPIGVFARTMIASDVTALIRGWGALPAGWCGVTSRGDVAWSNGLVIVRGTSRDGEDSSVLDATRAAALETELGALRTQRAGAADELARISGAHAEAIARHAAAADSLRDAEAGWRSAEADAEANRVSLGRAQRDLAELDVQLRRARAAEIAARERLHTLGPVDTSATESLERRIEELREQRSRHSNEREAARRRAADARARADAAVARGGQVQRERGILEARLEAARTALPALRNALEAAVREERQAATVVRQAASAVDRADEDRRAADLERDHRRDALVEIERETSGAAARLVDLERDSHGAAAEVTRHEERVASIRRELDLALEALEDADEATAVDDVKGLSSDELESELRSLRRTLGQLGSVNPFARSEHAALASRLDELTDQEADLDHALRSTETLIAQLEGEIAERFTAAFRTIGERFDEFVRLLFAGGSASLQTAEASEAGQSPTIEIAVRPPGKRLQRLEMLSGGERALAGVALLFAMLSVNPVPFCLLDEVDAALDEANVARFAEALRRLSTTTDFIVITHNRATIEMADTLYGITMTDAAVSRVVSLRLSEVPLGAAV